MSIKYRPKVSIKCCPAQAVAQLSKILECAHSGADYYYCTLEKLQNYLVAALLLVFVIKWMILKCSNLVFCRLATVDFGLDLLKRAGWGEQM